MMRKLRGLVAEDAKVERLVAEDAKVKRLLRQAIWTKSVKTPKPENLKNTKTT